jgi:hypothetical protein
MGIRSFYLFTALVFSLSANGQLRCENKLVNRGDSLFEVRELCGLPVYEFHRVDYRYPGYFVQIDQWIYEQGTNRFRRELEFEDGQLRDIKLRAKPRR